MDLMRRYKASFPDAISDDEILEKYTIITDVISKKISKENMNISIHNDEEKPKYEKNLERLKNIRV